MKNKVFKTLIFIFFIVIFDRTISFLISKYNHYLFKDNHLGEPLTKYLENNDFNTLILGTSRTYEAIHPGLLKNEKISPFKWSYAGNGPKYTYYFYKLYKKIKGAPELIIFGMDFFIYSITSTPLALSEINITASDKLLSGFFSPTLLLLKNKSRFDILFNDILSSFKISKSSLYKKIVDIQDYTGTEKSALINTKVNTERTGPYKWKPFFHPPGEEGNYFIKMLDEIHEDGVRIILVVIPDHIGTFRTNRFRRAFRRHLKKLKKMYNNLEVLNFNYIQKFALGDESLFIDGGYGYGNSHMSKKGAKLFNKMLKKGIENIE